jgi:SAM-dependent methyltransferase
VRAHPSVAVIVNGGEVEVVMSVNATQRDKWLSKVASARARLLNASFRLLYSRLAFLHELVGSAVFGRAWSARRRLLIASDANNALIVDVGCGEGRLLSDPGWGAACRIGIDPSPQATRRARRRGVLVVRGTAQRLPLRSAAVGQLVCSYPGPWIMDGAVWDEFARVLAPGGSLNVLLGGVTTRGHGARARWLAQRIAYGEPSVDEMPRFPAHASGFGRPAIPGAVERVDDAWGYAYMWRGLRVEHDPSGVAESVSEIR